MNNIIFQNMGNSIFKAQFIKNSIKVGHIIGITHYNSCNINELTFLPEYRSKLYGSTLLNFFETKMYNCYNINEFYVFAWDNIYCNSTSYLQFYLKNNYIINKNLSNIYHDNGEKIYYITPLIKLK